jgi:dCTP deaminase
MSDTSQSLFEARAGGLDGLSNGSPRTDIGSKVGILPRDRIMTLIHRKMIRTGDGFDKAQVQPASLDLRLGPIAFRVRASFLPGKESTVKAQLQHLRPDTLSLEKGAVLERGCVYVVPLVESLDLPESISAVANPKSSTGRLDVFTRLITDKSEVFDSVEPNYDGPLYAEISPRSFSIRVRKGSRLNQLRFRRRSSSQPATAAFRLTDKELEKLHSEFPLTDGETTIRNGLNLRVNLKAHNRDRRIGYRAQRFTDIIDVDEVGRYRAEDYWDEITARDDGRLILDPQQFYVLASKEALHIPPHLAAEMVPIDPTMGEFRVHYAGFFDPGFGHAPAGGAGSKAVLEVRSHEVPFILEDGQIIGRLAYEWLTEPPDQLYGERIGSHYQAQGLKLSKHFKHD